MKFNQTEPSGPAALKTWRKERQAWQAKRTKADKRADELAQAIKLMPARAPWAVQYVDGQLSEEDARVWLVELEARVDALATAFADFRTRFGYAPKEIAREMMACAGLVDKVQADLVMQRLQPRAKLLANAGLDLLGRRM
jgi:hypothetical protein